MHKDLENFLNSRKAKELVKGTLEYYQIYLELFLNFIGNKSVQEITIQDVYNFIGSLQKDHKQSSVLQIKRLLKAFFNYYDREKISKQIKLEKLPPKLPVIPSQNELITKIEKISKPRDKAICMFFYGTGLRARELTNLKKSDLRWYPINRVFLMSEKTKHYRLTLFPSEVQECLREEYWKIRKDNSEYVFANRDGSQMKYWNVYHIVKKNLDIKPHILRDAFATHLLENGVSLLWIMRFLGHKNIKSTLRYAQARIQQEDEALNKHPLHLSNIFEKRKAIEKARGFVSGKMSELENMLAEVIRERGEIPESMIGPKIGQFNRLEVQDKNKHNEVLRKLNRLNKIRVPFEHGKEKIDKEKISIIGDGFSFDLTTKEEKFSIEKFKNEFLKDYSDVYNYLSKFA